MANNSAHDFGIVAMRLRTQRHGTISNGYRFFAAPITQIDALSADWSGPACNSGMPEIKPDIDASRLHVMGRAIPCLFLGFGPPPFQASAHHGDADSTNRAWANAISKLQPCREIAELRQRHDFFGNLNGLHDLNHPQRGFSPFWRHLENSPAFISTIQPAFDALAMETSCSEAKNSSPKRSL